MKRVKSDSGLAPVISFIIGILAVIAMVVMIVDFAVFFNNRRIINNAVTIGAQIVAVGGGTEMRAVPAGLRHNTSGCAGAPGATSSLGACTVWRNLEPHGGRTGISAVQITSISCGPATTTNAINLNNPERVWCQVDWTYHGIAGTVMGSNQRTRISVPTEVRIR